MRAVKIEYEKMPWKQFRDNTGLQYKPVKMEGVGFSKYAWKAGVAEAWHVHDQEPQIVFCTSGKVEFGIRDEAGERTETLLPGDVILIQPGVTHRATSIEATEMLIIFSPMNRFDADALII
ncbi:MAG: Cupin domain [Ramlibacter sp.]|nr:Cupin domain [Ramlibacter sp.]